MTPQLITWRSAGLAALCGTLAVGALPPFHVWPLLFPAFSGFLWVLRGVKRPRLAFGLGWFFGFGHFLFGLYWISNALRVPPAEFIWMIPFALVGLPILLSFYPALIAWGVVSFVRPRASLRRWLSFGSFWLIGEWARAHFLTGFPWNLMATVWTERPEPLQAVAYLGPYGVGAVTVLIGGAFSLGFWRGTLASALGLALLWGGGGLAASLGPGQRWRSSRCDA